MINICYGDQLQMYPHPSVHTQIHKPIHTLTSIICTCMCTHMHTHLHIYTYRMINQLRLKMKNVVSLLDLIPLLLWSTTWSQDSDMTSRYIGAMVLSIVHLTIKNQPNKVEWHMVQPLHLLVLDKILYTNG